MSRPAETPDDAAMRAELRAPARAPDRRAARAVPHRVHPARHRGDVGRGDRRVPRDSRRDGAHAAFRARALLRESLAREIDIADAATPSASPARAAIASSPACSRASSRRLAPGDNGRRRRQRASTSDIHSKEIVMNELSFVVAVARLPRPRRARPGPERRADRAHRRHRQPGRHRRRQARRAKATNKEVKEFGKQMVTDHTGVNKQAAALVTKLKVTPEDNADQPVAEEGRRGERRQAEDAQAAPRSTRPTSTTRSPTTRPCSTRSTRRCIPNAKNEELKALIVKVRPAFVRHLDHAKHLQATLGK